MLSKLDRAVGLNIFHLSFQWKYAKYLKILQYMPNEHKYMEIFLKSLHLEFIVKTISKLNKDPLFKGRYIY